MAGSLLNTKTRPSAVQVLFNIANLPISGGACFFIGRVWLASAMTAYQPTVIAIVACAYFLVNTALVSGVLSLLQGKRLAEVCSQWYVWSFPYYLIGVALVGLVPSPGRKLSVAPPTTTHELSIALGAFLAELAWEEAAEPESASDDREDEPTSVEPDSLSSRRMFKSR